MSGHLTTPKAHLGPEYVLGHHGNPYFAPTVDEVDARINELRQRIAGIEKRLPNLAAELRTDIDKLLDRRQYLTMMNQETTP